MFLCFQEKECFIVKTFFCHYLMHRMWSQLCTWVTREWSPQVSYQTTTASGLIASLTSFHPATPDMIQHGRQFPTKLTFCTIRMKDVWLRFVTNTPMSWAAMKILSSLMQFCWKFKNCQTCLRLDLVQHLSKWEKCQEFSETICNICWHASNILQLRGVQQLSQYESVTLNFRFNPKCRRFILSMLPQ